MLNDISSQRILNVFGPTITTQGETLPPTAISTIVRTCHSAALQSSRAAITCCPFLLSPCQNSHVPVTTLCLWPVWSVSAPVNHLHYSDSDRVGCQLPACSPSGPPPLSLWHRLQSRCMSSCSFLIFYWNPVFLERSCWRSDYNATPISVKIHRVHWGHRPSVRPNFWFAMKRKCASFLIADSLYHLQHPFHQLHHLISPSPVQNRGVCCNFVMWKLQNATLTI